MYVRTNSTVLSGLKASLVTVEIDVSKGLPTFAIVGLASKSVSESRERVSVAMNSSGFEIAPKRILVNLSPAHIKKEGVQLDLAIAVALMTAFAYIKISPDILEETCFLGELSLTGELRSIIGMLPMAIESKQRKLKYLIVPKENASEAALVLADNKDLAFQVFAVNNLEEIKILCEALNQYTQNKAKLNPDYEAAKSLLEAYRAQIPSREIVAEPAQTSFSEIIGQAEAKRGLEIAAAGRHHLLMIGPPGCGKSMLAKRFINLLPKLSFNEALELSKIYSISGFLKNQQGLLRARPLRTPHHSITVSSLIGGGVPIRPGEVSLAHHGVLFLDELTEFDRYSIEVLRQILEEKEISLCRGVYACSYPADFILIAACNPCPCGYLGDNLRECSDSPLQISRYISKLSGPLLDRIDIHLELSRLNREEIESLGSRLDPEMDRAMYQRVETAQSFATELKQSPEELLSLDRESKDFISEASHKLGLSARAYTKTLRLGRSIANLEQSEQLRLEHIAEALQYRSLNWDQLRQSPRGVYH